jgi:hypothetical protein
LKRRSREMQYEYYSLESEEYKQTYIRTGLNRWN